MPLTKLDGEHGIVSVGADEGRIVIRVSEDRGLARLGSS